jgi:hypothetical protein
MPVPDVVCPGPAFADREKPWREDLVGWGEERTPTFSFLIDSCWGSFLTPTYASASFAPKPLLFRLLEQAPDTPKKIFFQHLVFRETGTIIPAQSIVTGLQPPMRCTMPAMFHLHTIATGKLSIYPLCTGIYPASF